MSGAKCFLVFKPGVGRVLRTIFSKVLLFEILRETVAAFVSLLLVSEHGFNFSLEMLTIELTHPRNCTYKIKKNATQRGSRHVIGGDMAYYDTMSDISSIQYLITHPE